ncbi:hypothetical protein FM21_29585 [Streptomyces mutabilis]|uniref:Permease n=1 Tax=Streptomyces mutabilis TaxID=67332 RepID=A0A086MTT6_9ACTN|nr:hypothetical protein FM21_29585 [Streptomyces mutabilis]
MFRVGLAASRGTPGGRLRFRALVTAAAALGVASVAVFTAVATFEGREQRDTARGPMVADSRDKAALLWRETNDAFGSSPHALIYLEPLTKDAPLPPGLDRWPEPGEVFMSPRLAEAAKEHGSLDRYGTYAGTISPEGLRSRSERIAYLRSATAPEDLDDKVWLPVRGFGVYFPALNPDTYRRTLSGTAGTLAVLLVVPALAFVVVAARVGSTTRDRRSQLVNALGASWSHRAVINVGEALVPCTVGTGLALIPAGFLLAANVRIPFTGYVLSAADMRQTWPLLAGLLVVSWLVSVITVVGLHRVQRSAESTRPGASSARLPKWRLMVCGAGVAGIVGSQYLTERAQVPVFLTGTVVMWAMLPTVVAMLSVKAGRKIAESGYRAGNAGKLVAGRWTVAHPGVLVRLSVVFVIGIGLISHIQVWNSRFGDTAAAARAITDRVGDTLLTVTSSTLTDSTVQELSQRLPAGARLLSADGNLSEERARLDLTGSCADLKALGLPCATTRKQVNPTADPRLDELAGPYQGNLTVRAVDRVGVPGANGMLVVVTDEPGQQAAVEKAAYGVHPGINVEPPGEGWVIGALQKSNVNTWLSLFGGTGLAMLLGAGLVAAAAEFVRIRTSLAPLSVLSGNTRVFRTVSWWFLTLPLLGTTVIATAVTNWHSLFFVVSLREGQFSWPVLAAAASFFAAAAIGVGMLAARSARRAAPLWQPQAD